MIFLGIDPGIAITGYGFLETTAQGNPVLIDYGVIDLTDEKDTSNRLFFLYQEIEKLILDHKPHAAAIEKLFFKKNVKTAMAVSEARGVIRYCLTKYSIKIKELTPNEVKLAVTSSGSADKRQVQEMVRILLGLEDIIKPDDASDAIAIALCALGSYKFDNLVLE
jgi:crossover junction endodeoxyribonuclease RuvC